jgi:hypothetical protein
LKKKERFVVTNVFIRSSRKRWEILHTEIPKRDERVFSVGSLSAPYSVLSPSFLFTVTLSLSLSLLLTVTFLLQKKTRAEKRVERETKSFPLHPLFKTSPLLFPHPLFLSLSPSLHRSTPHSKGKHRRTEERKEKRGEEKQYQRGLVYIHFIKGGSYTLKGLVYISSLCPSSPPPPPPPRRRKAKKRKRRTL